MARRPARGSAIGYHASTALVRVAPLRAPHRSAHPVHTLQTLSRPGALALALLLGGCAAPPPRTADAPDAVATATATDLACPLPGNCVNSLGNRGMPALRYGGTPAEGLARLQATLAAFPEARVVQQDRLTLTAIFTTPAGFRDQVDFRIDAPAQRIDFRSRSLFGLFDWGKNRARMTAFTARFGQPAQP